MLILCTNDDGYLSLALDVLATAAKSLGTVQIVAPDREQSATSHSLTMHHPLRARSVREGVHHVDGTPTDCVALAGGMEATILGIPAVAVSYVGRDPERIRAYGPLLERLLPQLLRRGDFPAE